MFEGTELGRTVTLPVTYGLNDVLLYNAAIGGNPLTAPQLVVERLGPVVAPTYAAVLGFRAFRILFADVGMDESKMLHLSQSVTVNRPLSPEGQFAVEATVSALWDKGSAAIVEVEARFLDRDEETAATTGTLLIKDAGGFGGERGPSRTTPALPDRPPMIDIESVSLNQTAVYRMCGDDNLLHVDPEAAAKLGFGAPIAHGLWTFASAVRRAVCLHADGRFDRVSGVSGDFVGPLFLGDTTLLTTWADANEIVGELSTTKGEAVLRNLRVSLF